MLAASQPPGTGRLVARSFPASPARTERPVVLLWVGTQQVTNMVLVPSLLGRSGLGEQDLLVLLDSINFRPRHSSFLCPPPLMPPPPFLL